MLRAPWHQPLHARERPRGAGGGWPWRAIFHHGLRNENFLASGAVEQRDRNYATPLKVAKKAGQAAMVEILLRHGAKVWWQRPSLRCTVLVLPYGLRWRLVG